MFTPLVLDGVYLEDGEALCFNDCDPPTDDEMNRLLATHPRSCWRSRRRAADHATCEPTGFDLRAGVVVPPRDRARLVSIDSTALPYVIL
jgi:hypothetical protein